jgi:hypothetical protein
MRQILRIVVWGLLGALFGIGVGILSRRLGYGDPVGGILTGAMVAPAIVMIFILGGYWGDLMYWTFGGAVLGAIVFVLIAYFGQRSLGGFTLDTYVTPRRVMNGAIVGAVILTWFGIGWSIFRGDARGIISLLISIIAGAFVGTLVWVVGDAIGGQLFRVQVAGATYVWRLGEMIAGVPVGIFGGALVYQFLYQSRKRESAF